MNLTITNKLELSVLQDALAEQIDILEEDGDPDQLAAAYALDSRVSELRRSTILEETH